MNSIGELISQIEQGDRKSIAKAITLVESKRSEDQELTENLLSSLPSPSEDTLRIGISGPPGVGKSTFIESFGTFLVYKNFKIGKSLVEAFGKDLKKSFASRPGSMGPSAKKWEKVGGAAGIDTNGAFTAESYDAAALIVLAMQAGGSADRGSIAKNVMAVANGPGTKIYPGQLKKGLDLLAKGKAIDYEGATGVVFTDVGEHVGNFLEKEIKGGKFKTKKQR